MRHAEEYRDGRIARALGARIARAAAPAASYRFMEFCGGHTHAIARYGIEDLLPGWTEDTVETLSALYEEDLDLIASIPGVRLLEP